MPAQIAAAIVNWSMGRPKKAVATEDFMPSRWRKKAEAAPAKKRNRFKRAEVADLLRNIAAQFTR